MVDIADKDKAVDYPVFIKADMSTVYRARRRFSLVAPVLGFVAVYNLVEPIHFALALLAGFAVILVLNLVFFSARRATPAQRDFNKNLYDSLFERTESNAWAQQILGLAIMKRYDFYAHSQSEVLSQLKGLLQERGVGQTYCASGHNAACVHRLPQKMKSWFLSDQDGS